MDRSAGLLETLSRYRRAGMPVSGQPRSLESGLADGGYTYFGRFFDRFLESRGYNQSTFAAECRRRGFKVGRPGTRRDIGQRSISDWMRGYAACPREVPIYADAIPGLSAEEWAEFGVAYGQTASEEDFEDLLEFRKVYRMKHNGDDEESSSKRAHS